MAGSWWVATVVQSGTCDQLSYYICLHLGQLKREMEMSVGMIMKKEI